MYDQHAIENRDFVINGIADQLVREGVDRSEIAAVKESALKKSYEDLIHYSLEFWSSRM